MGNAWYFLWQMIVLLLAATLVGNTLGPCYPTIPNTSASGETKLSRAVFVKHSVISFKITNNFYNVRQKVSGEFGFQRIFNLIPIPPTQFPISIMLGAAGTLTMWNFFFKFCHIDLHRTEVALLKKVGWSCFTSHVGRSYHFYHRIKPTNDFKTCPLSWMTALAIF